MRRLLKNDPCYGAQHEYWTCSTNVGVHVYRPNSSFHCLLHLIAYPQHCCLVGDEFDLCTHWLPEEIALIRVYWKGAVSIHHINGIHHSQSQTHRNMILTTKLFDIRRSGVFVFPGKVSCGTVRERSRGVNR